MAQAIDTALCTLLTTLVIKKTALDNTYYGPMYTLILSSVTYLTKSCSFERINGLLNTWQYHIIALILILAFVYLCHKHGGNALSPWRSTYKTISIYDDSTMVTVSQYIDAYPTFYAKDVDIDSGDRENAFRMQQNKNQLISFTSTKDDIEVPFFDTNYNTRGYIVWRKQSREINAKENKETLYIRQLDIAIQSSSHNKVDTAKYLEQIKQHMRDKTKARSTLVYIKNMRGKNAAIATGPGMPGFATGVTNHTLTIYDGLRKPFDVREKEYIYTFFHQERDRLWTLAKRIDQDPDFFLHHGQAAQLNLLLHGPPGTGKSTFVYRLAQALDRSIVSVDLRNQTRESAYQVVQRPTLNIPGCTNPNIIHKKIIILLEEFDLVVLELHSRSKRLPEADKGWKRLQREFLLRERSRSEKYSRDNGTGVFQSDEDDDEETPIKFSKAEVEETPFSVRDLLEVLQGPVAMNGQILLATTNKYDEMKAIYPELFRPGRLTAVYFGYITKAVLQEMSQYYFQRKIDWYVPDTLTIPTSQIIGLALEAKSIPDSTLDKAFEHFSQEMQKVLNGK